MIPIRRQPLVLTGYPTMSVITTNVGSISRRVICYETEASMMSLHKMTLVGTEQLPGLCSHNDIELLPFRVRVRGHKTSNCSGAILLSGGTHNHHVKRPVSFRAGDGNVRESSCPKHVAHIVLAPGLMAKPLDFLRTVDSVFGVPLNTDNCSTGRA